MLTGIMGVFARLAALGAAALASACGAAPIEHQPFPERVPPPRLLHDDVAPFVGPCGRYSKFATGEKTQHTIHGQDVDYTLTDRSLYVWRLLRERPGAGGEVMVESTCTRLDVTSVLERGLIAWQVGDDVAYFLTKDSHLVWLPLNAPAPQFTTRRLPFETARLTVDRFVYHAGMIFIAPFTQGLVILSFTPQLDSALIPLEVRDPRARFFLRNGRLFFGRERELETELVVAGQSAQSVSALEAAGQ